MTDDEGVPIRSRQAPSDGTVFPMIFKYLARHQSGFRLVTVSSATEDAVWDQLDDVVRSDELGLLIPKASWERLVRGDTGTAEIDCPYVVSAEEVRPARTVPGKPGAVAVEATGAACPKAPVEERWQCRLCAHSLVFASADADEARLAAVSHLHRCHRMGLWQVAVTEPRARREAETYFGRIGP
jgi:hypothetical protein